MQISFLYAAAKTKLTRDSQNSSSVFIITIWLSTLPPQLLLGQGCALFPWLFSVGMVLKYEHTNLISENKRTSQRHLEEYRAEKGQQGAEGGGIDWAWPAEWTRPAE